MVTIEKKERNKEIYEKYEKLGKMKGGISFQSLGKEYGIGGKACNRIYLREKWKRTKGVKLST